MARMSRLHNNSNVLVLGGRLTDKETSFKIVDAWLSGEFEAGRHAARVSQLDMLEKS
jgi:RpiB/LacA/LacB family sugar-phosphate isomerase